MLQQNNDTLIMQQILIDNLQNLGLNDMTGKSIGNYTTGEPDGLLGNGTATALNKLIIMAQEAAGVDKININAEYSSRTLDHVEKYLTDSGIDETTAKTFIESAKSLSGDGVNYDNYGKSDPVTTTAVQANGHVAAMQDVLITHLKDLGLEGVTAQNIGNAAGNPDDLLGKGTSTALQQLALKAQTSIGGVTPANTTIEYNEATLENIKDYMIAAQIPADTVDKFINEAKLVGTDFKSAYENAASVDVNTLQVRDFSAIAVIEKAPIDSSLTDLDMSSNLGEFGNFDYKAGIGEPFLVAMLDETPIRFVEPRPPVASLVVQPVTAPMTYAMYQDLKDDKLLSVRQEGMVSSFETLYEQEKVNLGLPGAETRLEAAMLASQNLHSNWADLNRERYALQNQIEKAERTFNKEETVDFTHKGEEYAKTIDDIKGMDDGAMWGDWDTDEEQALYDAGYAAGKEQMNDYVVDEATGKTYGQMVEDLTGMTEKLQGNRNGGMVHGSLYKDVRAEITAANENLNTLKETLASAEIPVPTGETEAMPEQLLAMNGAGGPK